MADAVPPNGVVSAVDVLTKLAPIFLGSGTTTGSESADSSAGISNLQDIITQAMGNVNDPAQVQAIISNIMTQAAQTFAPVLAQQNSAGLYNSSTLSMLSAMASGQATAQSAQAVLNFKTSQQQIAAQAAGKLADATRTVSSTKATSPVIDPMSSLLTVGGGILGSKALNAVTSSSAFQGAKDSISSALGFGDTAAEMAARTSGASDAITQVKGIDAGSIVPVDSSVVADTAGDSGILGGSLDSLTTDATSAASVDLGASAAVDAGSSIAGDLAGGIGENVGESVAADVGTDVAASTAEDTGASALSDLAPSWIICTELVKQGRMNKRYYIIGSKEFANYWEYGKRGYYLWAIPSVKHLRQKPNSWYSKMLCVIMNKRIETIAAHAGVRGANSTIQGELAITVLWLLSAVLAITVCPFCKDPDWLALYGEKA